MNAFIMAHERLPLRSSPNKGEADKQVPLPAPYGNFAQLPCSPVLPLCAALLHLASPDQPVTVLSPLAPAGEGARLRFVLGDFPPFWIAPNPFPKIPVQVKSK
jgi:hypothetical protein